MTTVPHRWKKSSRSSTGTNCVELAWKKSSYSGTGTNCVELAYAGLMRDSKLGEAGPVLTVRDLPEFIRQVRAGRLDR